MASKIATSYYTENTLKTWEAVATAPELQPYVLRGCDAVAEITIGDTSVRFAIEYEATLKRWQRYDGILGNYYNNSNIPFVIYICGSDKIKINIQSKDRNLFKDKKPKLFYICFDKFIEKGEIILENRIGQTLKIGQNG